MRNPRRSGFTNDIIRSLEFAGIEGGELRNKPPDPNEGCLIPPTWATIMTGNPEDELLPYQLLSLTTIFEDAPLMAVAVMREVVAESCTDDSCVPAVLEILRRYLEKYRDYDRGDLTAMLALTNHLGHLAVTAQQAALHLRLGRSPSQDEMLDVLDDFELIMLEPRQGPGDRWPRREAGGGGDQDETP